MSPEDELEVKCLVVTGSECPYRGMLKTHFGYVHLKTECVYRKLLKLENEHYELKKYHKNFEQEFPNG